MVDRRIAREERIGGHKQFILLRIELGDEQICRGGEEATDRFDLFRAGHLLEKTHAQLGCFPEFPLRIGFDNSTHFDRMRSSVSEDQIMPLGFRKSGLRLVNHIASFPCPKFLFWPMLALKSPHGAGFGVGEQVDAVLILSATPHQRRTDDPITRAGSGSSPGTLSQNVILDDIQTDVGAEKMQHECLELRIVELIERQQIEACRRHCD